jgi:hydrogenase maturation protease
MSGHGEHVTTRTAIIGIGNVLNGDDGIGPTVVKVLAALYEFPEGVTCEDLGTPGYELITFIMEQEAVVLVDATRLKGAPGEVHVVDKPELLKRPLPGVLSAHEPGVREALLNAEFQGVAPKVFKLVGVIPEQVESNAPLSPVVRAAVQTACKAVLMELEKVGVKPTLRSPPAVPDLWWEKPRLA